MPESVYFPIIDNGMGLSRTGWGMSMFELGISGVLAGRQVFFEQISYPYPDGAMQLATATFRERGLDRMVVIDTDETFRPDDVRILLSHDLQFVSGLYPKKRLGLEFPVVPLDGDDNPFIEDENPLREVARCARGFLSLHRSVFDILESHVSRYFCEESKKEQPLFWNNLPGGHSEDFALCDLWRRHGGKVWIDKRIVVRHEGSVSYPIPGTY